jgi:hypothetical protein
MDAKLHFDPKAYTEPTLRLILKKASDWECTPAEAVRRLLDDLAVKAGYKPRATAEA